MGTLAALATELSGRSDAALLRLLELRPDAMTPAVPDFATLAARLSMRTSIDLALDRLNVPQLQTLAALVAGAASPGHGPFLPTLHELALVVQVSPAHMPLGHDAGAHHFLPLAAVAPVLGGGAAAEVSPLPLPPELLTVRVRIRDNASAAAIDMLLRGMATLLDCASAAGIDSLRGGAVSVRGLRTLAKSTRFDEARLCFYLELAAIAGLVSLDGPALQWRVAAAEWSALDRPRQWVVLVQAWLNSSRPPAAGFAPGNGRQSSQTASPMAARPLAPATPHRHAATWRRNVVLALSQLSGPPAFATPTAATPAGCTPTGTTPTATASTATAPAATAATATAPAATAPTSASLLSFLAWRHPRQSEHMATQLPGLLSELELLGITGAGALSGPGCAVAIADWDGAVDCVGGLLPAPIQHFLIQGDLTAVAPGFLAPAVAAQLKLMAVPEGDGTAGIYRFSQGSLEDAIRSGMDKDAILDFLQHHCSTTVPQSLGYLIVAAARTVTASASPPDYSHLPNPSGAANFGAANTSGIATTPSVVSPAPPRQAVKAQKFPSGAARPEAVRREAVRPETVQTVATHTEAEAQIVQLRSRPVWADTGGGESGPALVMEQLRQAVARSGRILLQAVNGTGTVERVLLEPVSLEAGMLRARLPGTGLERRFSIHRIVAAEPAVVTQEEEQEEFHG